eukprot:2914390-Alexandrium_andersonii.AAC.1
MLTTPRPRHPFPATGQRRDHHNLHYPPLPHSPRHPPPVTCDCAASPTLLGPFLCYRTASASTNRHYHHNLHPHGRGSSASPP